MTGKKVLILGSGFGGLAAAQQLRRLLPPQHRITVVERKTTFYLNAFNMQLLTGQWYHTWHGPFLGTKDFESHD